MAIKKTTKSAATKSAPAKAKPTSLAHLFDETDMSEASNMLPEGEHEVRLNSFEIKDKPGKGTAAFVEYEAIDGDYEGRKVRQMYMLTEPNGEKKQGMAYLKRDLALLGYEDVKGKDLESSLQTLTEEQPICIINVKNNGQYVNAYLQGLAENVATGDDAEADAEAAPEIEIGTKVQFDSDGDTVTGTVLRIKADSIRVKGDDGEIYNTTLDELEIFTEEDNTEEAKAETEIAVGSQVTFDDDGDEKSGEVIKIKGNVAIVKDEDGDKFEVDLDDLTLAEAAEKEAEAEIEVGSRVTWDDDGTDMEGEVTAIKWTKATIKDDDDDKHKVELEDLTLAD